MRLALAIVLAVGLAASTGCANTSIIENQGDAAKLDDVPRKTVVIWHTYSDEETRMFEEAIIPAFEQEHPDIHVESVRQAYNQEFQAALIARASASKTPDLVRMDYSWVPKFAKSGLLEPLDGYPGYEAVVDSLRERMLETGRYRGRIYGLPLNITTKAAIFNRKLMADAGLEEPPASFRDLARIAKERKLVLGMAGIDMWSSLPYFFGLGGRLANEEFTRTQGYLNGEDSIAAVETMVALYDEGVLNPQLLSGNADLWRDVYADNDTLMIDEGPWYYSILLNTSDLRVDLLDATLPAPFPSDAGYGSVIGGESLVLTKGARHKPEAWTFIQWMMKAETQLALSEAGLIPTNLEALDEGGTDGASRYIAPYLKGIEDGYYLPAIPEWSQVDQMYRDAMEDVFVNRRDVRETLNEASAYIDLLLAK